jgi:hypothetical protein
VTDDGAIVVFAEEGGEAATGGPDRPRMTHADGAQVVDRYAGRLEFVAEPTGEAEGETRLHRGAVLPLAGERHEERFDAAVEVAGVQVEDFQNLTANTEVNHE